jgi:hypothetical protein
MVVTKTTRMPTKNKTSAIFSHLPPSLILPLMERNESTQLSINEMIATITISSITVLCAAFRYFKEVNTTKHKPKRLDDAFKIWGDLLFWRSFMG